MIDAHLRDAATRWFMMRQSGEMAYADREAFNVWMETHPDAALAYHQAERVWGMIGDVAKESDVAASRTFNRRRYRRVSHSRRWAITGLVASTAFVAVALPDRVAGFVDTQLAPVRGGGQLFTTGARRRASTTLADGTVVNLDTGTKLRVLEMGARRRVELLVGHAFFRVAKDPAHPFLVTAKHKIVRAIGTAFDVRVEPDAVAVTLVEGKVRVDESRGLLRKSITTNMTAGKQLIATNDQVWMMTPIDTAEATSWLGDRLTYLPESLGKIVADVNNGSKRKIVFLGPIDQQQRIVGVFERGDVDSVATVLEMQNIAHVVARSGDRIEMMRGNADRQM